MISKLLPSIAIQRFFGRDAGKPAHDTGFKLKQKCSKRFDDFEPRTTVHQGHVEM